MAGITERDRKPLSGDGENLLYSGEHSTPDGYSFRMNVRADGIGFGVSCGYETMEIAHGIRALFVEAREKLGKPYPMCFDISKLEGLDPRARKIWSNTALSKDGPFSRVAIHGGNFFVMSLMNFYARIARIPVRCFKTQDAALAWLKDEVR
jgi:hypothetical protein